MKKLLFLICISICLGVNAQEFKRLKREGDSLNYKGNTKAALVSYGKAVDLIIEDKDKVYDYDWFNILNSAGNIIQGRNRYWNMLYGSHAEKLSEKMIFLKEMGVKYMFSYQINEIYDVPYYHIPHTCKSSTQKMLVWAFNNTIFLQAFDDCDTYKPIKVADLELTDLLTKHYDEVATSNIRKPDPTRQPSGRTEYRFEFYTKSDTLHKDWVNVYYLADPKARLSPSQIARNQKYLDRMDITYQYNLKSYLAKLLLRIVEVEKIYNATISSNTERAKVGKIE